MSSNDTLRILVALAGIFIAAFVLVGAIHFDNASIGLATRTAQSLSSSQTAATSMQTSGLVNQVPLSCGNGICDAGETSQTCPAECLDPVVSFSWYNGGNLYELRGVRCTNASCSQNIQIPTLVIWKEKISNVALSPVDNAPLFLYLKSSKSMQFGYDINAIKCLNPTCSTYSSSNIINTIQDSPSNNTHIGAVIPLDNHPVVVYNSLFPYFKLYLTKCGDASCSSGNVTTILDSNVTGINDIFGVALGSDGLPIVVYSSGFFGSKRTIFLKCENSACNRFHTQVIPVIDIREPPTIAISQDGNPIWAVPVTNDRNLTIVKCSTPDCSGIPQISTHVGNIDAQFIVVPPDNIPLIAYIEYITGTPIGPVKTLKCGSLDCMSGTETITTIDPLVAGDHTVYDLGMALVYGRTPVIVYAKDDGSFPNYFGHIRAATCLNYACTSYSIAPDLFSNFFKTAYLAVDS